jgi:hypothetical protein
MAVQPSPYLVMTDGTDTVTFQDGANPGGQTNWGVVRGKWAPSIAGIRTSQLGGRGPYADVQEDLSCNILGTTAALAWQNLDTLIRLLDKAERWWLRNENISPVVLKYAPQGSTIHSNATPMQAVVLGRVGSDELNGVDLPSNVNDAGFIFQIHDVRVLCLRRGGWTGLSETPATSASSANPSVLTRAFASTHPINSPVDITIGGFDRTATPTIKGGYLCIGSNVNDIQFGTPSLVTGYTSVADSANLAKFGFVVRYTPTTTNPVLSGSGVLGAAVSGTIALYAAVRNNSLTTSFQISGVMNGQSGSSQTPYQLVDTSSQNPRLIYLGEVVGTSMNNVLVQVAASTASGTLDINYLLCVNLRDETVAVIAHDDVAVSLISSGAVSLNFKFNPLTDQQPTAFASGTNNNTGVPYRGPLPLLAVGLNIYALWTATNSNFWVFTNVSNTAVAITLAVTRYRSFLSPQ